MTATASASPGCTSESACSPLASGLLDVVHALYEDGDPQPDKLLLGLLNRCVEAVPGAHWASLTERASNEDRPVTSIATAPISYDTDVAQYESGQGPCLEAVTGSPAIGLDDIITELRWPEFRAQLAADSPVRSALSVPVPTAGRNHWSINLYSGRPHAFTAAIDQRILSVVASIGITLTALAERNRADHLQIALESNRQIGTAVGILMIVHKCTADEAFTVLRVASQHSHRKLRELAEEVVFTGTLPPIPATRRRKPVEHPEHDG